MEQQQRRVVLFYSCDQSDDILCDKLTRFLRPLVREAHVAEWSAQQILAGADFAQERKRAWESATHILLLLSADYLASEALYQEMLDALKRQERGEVRVIPIRLRPCLLPKPLEDSLSCLPDNGQPVSAWRKRDEALVDVARDICRILGLPLTSFRHGSTDRDYLLDQVFIYWIEGLLEPSLQGRFQLNLAWQEQPDALVNPEALANPWSTQVQELQPVPRPLPVGRSIAQAYDDANGELLILGEPGAGKTTLLLELTRTLLRRAEKDERARMPAVFHLSSWAKKRQKSLDAWLVEELATKYRVPRKIGRRWIDTNQIFPLLDGLDELADPTRMACVQAIEAYRAQTQRELVVCCRREEYFALSTRLTLQRAISIQPLTDDQIEHYLQHAKYSTDGQWLDLQQVLHNDRELNELAHRPLMLSIFTIAYQEATATELPTGETPEETQSMIFARYVERMLYRRGRSKRWEPQQVIHWITYLAKQMQRQQETTFLVEDLKPNSHVMRNELSSSKEARKNQSSRGLTFQGKSSTLFMCYRFCSEMSSSLLESKHKEDLWLYPSQSSLSPAFKPGIPLWPHWTCWADAGFCVCCGNCAMDPSAFAPCRPFAIKCLRAP
jgi:NACHT domain/TIR domain